MIVSCFQTFLCKLNVISLDSIGNTFLDYVFTCLEHVSPLSEALISPALFQFHMELPHLDMSFRITLDKNFFARWFNMQSILIVPSLSPWLRDTYLTNRSHDQCLQQKVRKDWVPKLLSVHNANFSWCMLSYHHSTSTVKADSLKCTGVCTQVLQWSDTKPEALIVHIHKCIQNCSFNSLEPQNY